MRDSRQRGFPRRLAINPGGGYTYHDSAVLIGKWNRGGTLDWRMSALEYRVRP